jgi:putative endonuclease
MTSREIGNIGENAVAAFLEHNGYEILKRNFTVRGGEIDIIARKGKYLVFVEVKTRKSGSLTSGESAITVSKHRHIVKTAEIYYRRYKEKYGTATCRFDVAVAEIEYQKIKHVKYYVAAFDATGR